jgi:hypothetical protein
MFFKISLLFIYFYICPYSINLIFLIHSYYVNLILFNPYRTIVSKKIVKLVFYKLSFLSH